MSELITVLKEEHNRQMEWLKLRRDAVNTWMAKNSYDYSKSLPRNYAIPKSTLDKAIKWYRILFIVGIVFALFLN